MYKQAHTDIGNYGEARVKELLESAGIEVEFGGPADLLLEGSIPLEVKTAKHSAYNGSSHGFQFCIDREGHTSLKGVAVVLLCLTPSGEEVFFIIPANIVGKRKKLGIGKDPLAYRGMWSQYRDRWDLIAQAV